MRLLLLSVVIGGIVVMPACPPPVPATRTLRWDVYNGKTKGDTYYSDGDTVGPPKETFDPTAQYTVNLVTQDPNGVKQLDVSGFGNNFICQGVITHTQNQGVNPLSAHIVPPTTLPTDPSSVHYQNLASTPFIYYQLDCGIQHFGNNPPEDFEVISGILTVTGTETSGDGSKQSITLEIGQ